MALPLVLIHLRLGFSKKKHPAIKGYPLSTMETPMWNMFGKYRGRRMTWEMMIHHWIERASWKRLMGGWTTDENWKLYPNYIWAMSIIIPNMSQNIPHTYFNIDWTSMYTHKCIHIHIYIYTYEWRAYTITSSFVFMPCTDWCRRQWEFLLSETLRRLMQNRSICIGSSPMGNEGFARPSARPGRSKTTFHLNIHRNSLI